MTTERENKNSLMTKPNQKQFGKVFTIVAWVLLITSCSRYDVRLNNNVIYSPPSLFSEYKIPDVALKECIRRTIAEEKIKKAKELLRLECPNLKITQLDGIETFSFIKILNLKNNNITDVSQLVSLTKLEQLNLEQNALNNIEPLMQLNSLLFLTLANNPKLNCKHIELVERRETRRIKAPKHCTLP